MPRCASFTLPIFWQQVEDPTATISAAAAARAIQEIAGGDEARLAWMILLRSADAEIVAEAIPRVRDPDYVPILLDLLRQHPDPSVRIEAMGQLGRMRDPRVR